MKKALIYWFAFLLILLWMTSCASRKTQKSANEIATNEDLTIAQKADVVTKSNGVVTIENNVTAHGENIIYKITVTPIDVTKPTVFTDSDGTTKTVRNGTYYQESQQAKTSATDLTKVVKVASLDVADYTNLKIDLKATSKEKAILKQSERKSFSWWLLLIIIIPSAFYTYWRLKY